MFGIGRKRALAVYGGSFYPITYGHVAVIKLLLSKFERVAVVPAYKPHHKEIESLYPFNDRLRWISDTLSSMLTSSELERVDISSVEMDCGSSSSYEMMSGMCFNNFETVLVIGGDQLELLDTWKNWKELVRLYRIVVITRDGYSIKGHPTTTDAKGFIYLEKKYEFPSASDFRRIFDNLKDSPDPASALSPYSHTHVHPAVIARMLNMHQSHKRIAPKNQ